MTDLFVSYSRKNTDTARKLTATLQEQKLEFWIDWEGIPPSVEWWQQVKQGIEESDVFVFLLSPDSAASKVCNQELEHAVKNGKRLIPVVICDIPADEVPVDLKPLNWIFLRDYDDFKTNFELLITAIKTDYPWVQTHRQLQLKALEWERSTREKSLLLRGKELQTTESSLALNAAKEPALTTLQREYMAASKKEKVRQVRLLANTGLAVLFAITWLSYTPVKSWLATPELPGWRPAGFVLGETPDIIAMNFKNPDQVYVSSQETGWLYGSPDGGSSWHKLSALEGSSEVIGLGAIEENVFTLTDHEIWISQDEGKSWSQATDPRQDQNIRFLSISLNPLKENELYVGSDNGLVYQSKDTGSTWEIIESGYEGKLIHAIAINGSMIVVATEEGVWTKNMKRNTWSALSLAGCTDHSGDVVALAFTHPYDVPPPDGAYGFFAAVRGLGICDSDTLNRHGNSWIELSKPADQDVSSIVIANKPGWTIEGYMIAGNEILRKRIWYSHDLEWWKLKVESLGSKGG